MDFKNRIHEEIVRDVESDAFRNAYKRIRNRDAFLEKYKTPADLFKAMRVRSPEAYEEQDRILVVLIREFQKDPGVQHFISFFTLLFWPIGHHGLENPDFFEVRKKLTQWHIHY